MYNSMKILIRNKVYATGKIAQDKIDTFLLSGRITIEQYKDLTSLIKSLYEESNAEASDTLNGMLKRLIQNGDSGISEKMEAFYSVGQLAKEEYEELVQMLNE